MSDREPASPVPADKPPEERDGRRRRGTENSTTTAVILIVVGAVLLLGRGLGVHLDNWWALFILIPAVASVGTAYRAYQANRGVLDRRVTGPALTGGILVLVAAVFLFGLDWGLMGAVIIILVGAGMLVRRGVGG